MKIFRAGRAGEEVDYEEYDGFVVAARNEADALKLIENVTEKEGVECDPNGKISIEGTKQGGGRIIVSGLKTG